MNEKSAVLIGAALVATLIGTSGASFAGGLFGEGGLIRGDIGKALDKTIEKPIMTPLAKGAEKTIKEVGETLEKTGKGALAASGLKALEDTLIEGKSLDKSLKESLADIKTGVKASAESLALPNIGQVALTEATKNALGKEAGRTLGLVLLPEQILRTLPSAATDALISASEKDDNIENVVGIPLSSAVKQAYIYYRDKGKSIPEGLQRLLKLTFNAEHLANVKYVVDSDGGNIAGLINGIKEVTGDLHEGNHAVAIDNIIVFAKEPKGVADLFFWAHEIQHTVQYKNLGVDGFAAKYTNDYKSIENEADVVAKQAVDNVALIVSALAP